MVHEDERIADLIRNYATALGLSESYASRILTGSGDTVQRISRGTSLTARRAARIIQAASDNWPADLAWPPDIPRPAPSASVTQPPTHRNGSPKPAPDPAPADPMESVIPALERKAAAIASASALNAEGRLASPDALCRAMDVERFVYDQVVRTYADGRPGQHKSPRRLRKGACPSELMLRALVAAGDARFQSRRMARALIQAS